MVTNVKYLAEHPAHSKGSVILSFAIIFYDISWNRVPLDRTMAMRGGGRGVNIGMAEVGVGRWREG